MPGIYTADSNNEEYSAKEHRYCRNTIHYLIIYNRIQTFYISYSLHCQAAVFQDSSLPKRWIQFANV